MGGFDKGYLQLKVPVIEKLMSTCAIVLSGSKEAKKVSTVTLVVKHGGSWPSL